MPELQVIFDAIKEMNKSHDKCIDSLKGEIYTGLRASAVQINSEMEVVNNQLKELIDHVKEQNSNVASLQTESNLRKQIVIDFRALETKHKKRDEFIRKNWFWIILGFIFFVAVVVITVEIIGAKAVIQKAIEKVSML